jgi:hypothetical protein
MTVFATLLTMAMTGQLITQSMPPKEGDLIALIDSQTISGWSDRSLVGQATDRAVPNGTLGTFVSRSLTRQGRIARAQPYSNPAASAGSSEAARAMLRSKYPQLTPPSFYDTVRLAGTNQSFTCYNGPVWLITNLEGAKTAYRDAADQLAKHKAKPRPPGNKKHASALAARDMAKLQTELMARYSLKRSELQALIGCGQANHWDDGTARPATKGQPKP